MNHFVLVGGKCALAIARPANIRIIRIFEYNFAHACILLFEYETNEYCQPCKMTLAALVALAGGADCAKGAI